MKVTLNDAIPAARRQMAEDIVRQMAPGAEVKWLPSRFPRLVMFVEPDLKHIEKSAGGSIFDEAPANAASAHSDLALQLEDKLQRGLAGSGTSAG